MMKSLDKSIAAAIEMGWMPQPYMTWKCDIDLVRRDAFKLLNYCVNHKKANWLDEYDKITEWFANMEGQGLLISGKNGVGKTLFAMRIIPTLLFHYVNLVPFVGSAVNLHSDMSKIVNGKHRVIVIDDIGVESSQINDYGTKRAPFPELLDYVEKNRAVLVATTNLGKEELIERYGVRTFDRILGNTNRVFINQKTMRS